MDPKLKHAIEHSLDTSFENLNISKLPDIHTVVVTLNRPEKRNAINAKMWREIGEAFHKIGSLGDGSRCVLLIGAGQSFCAGIDVSDENFGLIDMESIGDERKESVDIARNFISFRPKILEMQNCLTAVEQCSIPVVCAIHGACIGGGIDLSCCADIRVCTGEAKFGVREARLGLAADVGTLQRLPKICGHTSRIRELCYTGEDFNSEEAARIGFVSRLSTSHEQMISTALNICKMIARNSPVAVYGTKLSLNYSRDHSVQEGLDHIATHNSAALMTADLEKSFLAQSSGYETEADFRPLLSNSKL